MGRRRAGFGLTGGLAKPHAVLEQIWNTLLRSVLAASHTSAHRHRRNFFQPIDADNLSNTWLKVFKADPPPKIGRWRLLRGSDDRNRVHVVGEMAASEVKAVKDWIKSQHMQDVFKRVNAMSTAPLEFIWLEELAS